MANTPITLVIPRGTKVIHVQHTSDGWRLWLATKDLVHGTYWLLSDTGDITRVTERAGEGPDMFTVRSEE